MTAGDAPRTLAATASASGAPVTTVVPPAVTARTVVAVAPSVVRRHVHGLPAAAALVTLQLALSA